MLDVHSRVGELEHSLFTLEHCRVSWGKVVQVDGGELAVDRVPLKLDLGKLALGEPIRDRVVRHLDGRGFTDAAQPGDWLSIHWGWACEVLTEREVRNLGRYTRHHLAIANETL